MWCKVYAFMLRLCPLLFWWKCETFFRCKHKILFSCTRILGHIVNLKLYSVSLTTYSFSICSCSCFGFWVSFYFPSSSFLGWLMQIWMPQVRQVSTLCTVLRLFTWFVANFGPYFLFFLFFFCFFHFSFSKVHFGIYLTKWSYT